MASLQDTRFTGVAEPEGEPVLLGAKNIISKFVPKSGHEHMKRVKAYQGMDTPWGLASMLAREDPDVALRIFLLDNSGSTSNSDGHVLEVSSCGHLQSVPATRWDEISAMALDQAEWNARAGVRSEFILLNPPCPQDPLEGRDFALVDPKAGDAKAQVEVLARILQSNGPRGTTPLARCLSQLRQRLQQEVHDGRRIMLSIVTDGLPTAHNSGSCTQLDKDAFVQELRTFSTSFNSFIVIRLATDDDSAVEYYNQIDEELELPLDILDDLRGEATELHGVGNGWFAYTPMLHRIREGGTLEKIFDLLDERALKPAEIRKFLELLLRGPDDAAFPSNPKELYKVVENALAFTPLVYNGRLCRMTPLVDMKLLKKALGLSAAQHMKALPGRMLRALTCSSKMPLD